MERHTYKTDAGEFVADGKLHKASENFDLHWLVEVTDRVMAKVQSAYEVTDTEANPTKMVWSALNEVYPEAGLLLEDFNRTAAGKIAERAENKAAREVIKSLKAEEKQAIAAASSAEKKVMFAWKAGMSAGKSEADIVTALKAEGITDDTLKIYFPSQFK
jgi:hypothetical protein